MPYANQYGSFGSSVVIKTGWGYDNQNIMGGYSTAQKTDMKLYDEVEDIQKMKTLYNVIVVDLDGELIIDTKIVAETEEEAKFESGVYEALDKKELKLSDVTIICTKLGTVKVRPVKD